MTAAFRLPQVFCFALCVLISAAAAADTLRIAVASNFANAIAALAEHFEAQTGHTLSISFGSTGKHYAQIINGAPFDLFLAADAERPERLEREGRTIGNSRHTYAVGRLVVWAPQHDRLDLPAALSSDGVGRIAIANPRLAPYGRAAREALIALDLWEPLRPRLVRGENVGQAFQFVFSGNADIGFVASAQLKASAGGMRGARWAVPASLHAPIEQQAVLLRDSSAGRAFLAYLQSDVAQTLIQDAGYTIP